MKKLLIEPHYFGSLEYFTLIKNFEEVQFEVCDSFKKQTYRNRTYILGSNRILQLGVPLKFSNGTPTKDVRIDYSQRWVKDHWGAIYSSYGKAPFFEFFADEFQSILKSEHKFLVDLSSEVLVLCRRVLGINLRISTTDTFEKSATEGISDYRNAIEPKKPFSDRNIYQPEAYSQLFGDTFVPNLSIIDLIMCEGPKASEVLASSYREG